ncbi:MAG: hypothetical protein LUF26_01645 [Firmicutes bacterium]|nr:hypothetical protein [Bacillota bacterium]
MKKFVTITAIVLVIAVCDLALTYNGFMVNSDYFVKNDFEITRSAHSEKTWDRVFFGNSAVSAAYIEGQNGGGYVNLGIDEGTVTDLRTMIDRRFINIGSELLIGLSGQTLYDGIERNTEYIWYKKLYEPYVYFERARLLPALKSAAERLRKKEAPLLDEYISQSKAVYRGAMPRRAAEAAAAEYAEIYSDVTAESFEENISALEDIIKYCNENDIRVRVVWMPWNGAFEKPEAFDAARAAAEEVLGEYNVETLDLENAFESGGFYDAEHLNYDVGSPEFTQLIDEWQ